MTRRPAFSEALLRAKKAFNAQANREGRQSIKEHDLEEAVWAVYELLTGERPAREPQGKGQGKGMAEDQQGTSILRPPKSSDPS